MSDFNPNKPSTFIQYLDANNLYGCAMPQKLPTHGFKWLKDLTVESTKELLSQRLSNPGYILEVDLEYPKKLWDQHNDYPLAPEKLKIDTIGKLVGSFYPKSRYVLHYQNLKQYLSLGMKLTAVHRGIKFKQSTWMSPYITKNLNSKSLPQTVLRKIFSN